MTLTLQLPPLLSGPRGGTGASVLSPVGPERSPERDPAKAVAVPEATLRPGLATAMVRTVPAAGAPGARGGAALRRAGLTA